MYKPNGYTKLRQALQEKFIKAVNIIHNREDKLQSILFQKEYLQHLLGIKIFIEKEMDKRKIVGITGPESTVYPIFNLDDVMLYKHMMGEETIKNISRYSSKKKSTKMIILK